VFDRLDVISTQFVVALWALAAVACAGAGYLVWRMRRRRVAWAALGGFWSVVLIVVAGADTINAHYAYWPTVRDVRQALTGDRQWVRADALTRLTAGKRRRALHRGLVVKVSMPSDPLDGFRATSNVVYLPPQYFADDAARFPVVYLFHGSPGKPADWFHGGKAENKTPYLIYRFKPLAAGIISR